MKVAGRTVDRDSYTLMPACFRKDCGLPQAESEVNVQGPEGRD